MRRIVLAGFLFVLSCGALAARVVAADDSVRVEDLSPEQRKQRIRDEIESRRLQRTELMLRSPGVWQPGPDVIEADYSSIEWAKAPIGFVAQFYASLLQREVMVSSSVARIEVTISGRGMTKQDAVACVEKALSIAGVEVTPIGGSSIAFTAKSR